MGTIRQGQAAGRDALSGGRGYSAVIARAAGAVVALIGIIVFAGWTFASVPAGKSLHSTSLATFFAMKVNTAIGLLLGGIALLLDIPAGNPRDFGRFGKASTRLIAPIGLVIGLVGLLTLIEYMLGRNLGIDEAIFRDTLGAEGPSQPGRMAVNTALAFLFVGTGFLGGNTTRGQRVREVSAFATTLIASAALVVYAYGVNSFYGLATYTRMAPHTAVALVALGIGVLCSRPDRGLMGLLFGEELAGQVGRRLLPAAILAPIGLGWLRIKGERAGLYSGEFGVSIFVMSTMVLLCASIFWSLKSIDVADEQRRRAEVALQTYADLAKNTPIGFLVWHLEQLDDAKTFTLSACNPAGDRILGVTLATHIGESMISLFPGLGDSPRLEQYAEVIRLGQARDFGEIRGTNVATSQRIYSVRAFPLPDQALGVSFEDVTARRDAEDGLRREKDATDAANRELEAFSYSVSHDLRAPLRGLDGFSQALLEDYANKLDDIGKDYLGRIRAGAQRMGQLIDDLIDLSRVTRGELQRSKVNLSRIAREVADDLHRDNPSRRVEIVIEDGLIAEGDPKLLKVALDNLIGNAWKFTANQVEARIEFGKADAGDGRAAYFVRDNGAGFDMTYAHRLFGAFQRLHALNEFPGTGIGLATVQRVVRRHGGRVWAEGAVGKGAAFSFTL